MAAKKKPAKKSAAKPAKKVAAKLAKRAAVNRAAPRKAPAKKVAPKKRSAIPVVHWEIQAVDAKRMHAFYSDLFGWSIDTNNPMDYGMVSSGGGLDAINGGIGGGMGSSRVVVYAQVPDIDATLAKAESLGAKTMLPRTDMGPVTLAIFEDLEGNAFGIIEGD